MITGTESTREKPIRVVYLLRGIPFAAISNSGLDVSQSFKQLS